MAKLVYNLLSMQELKRRLKECHLSMQGSRDQLIKRHQNFVHIYNAQCDSLNPKSGKNVWFLKPYWWYYIQLKHFMLHTWVIWMSNEINGPLVYLSHRSCFPIDNWSCKLFPSIQACPRCLSFEQQPYGSKTFVFHRLIHIRGNVCDLKNNKDLSLLLYQLKILPERWWPMRRSGIKFRGNPNRCVLINKLKNNEHFIGCFWKLSNCRRKVVLNCWLKLNWHRAIAQLMCFLLWLMLVCFSPFKHFAGHGFLKESVWEGDWWDAFKI